VCAARSCQKKDLKGSDVPMDCEELHLRASGTNDAEVAKLMASIKAHNSGKMLRMDLGENHITGVGMKTVMDHLPYMKNLKGLSMERCEIGDAGAEVIANALRNPETKLEDLYLGHNTITPKGIKAIIAALDNNKILHTLDLQKNTIKNSGAKAIAAYIEQNKPVQKMWLDAAGIGHRGLQHLSAALQKNSNLVHLELMANAFHQNIVHDRVMEKILNKLDANRKASGVKHDL